MKRLLLIASALFVFTAANAQDAPKAEKPKMSKEEKERMKEKQEADLNAAFLELGLTEEQADKVRSVLDEANNRSKEARNDAKTTDDQKKETIKAIGEEKNQKLKEIMGEEKYQQFVSIRKRQREANQSMSAPKPAGN